MPNLHDAIEHLRRPRLLMEAARHGLRQCRERCPESGGAAEATELAHVLHLEAQLEDARRNRAAGYSPAEHVAVLIRLLRAAAAHHGAPPPGTPRPLAAAKAAACTRRDRTARRSHPAAE